MQTITGRSLYAVITIFGKTSIRVPKLFVLLSLAFSLSFPATAISTHGQQTTQEESEGDLEVDLNGEVFTTGQIITISGSIGDPGDQPILNIEVLDPEGSIVARASPVITQDNNTFKFSFEAGGQGPFMFGNKPMTISGNYRVTVTYLHSLTSIDEVNFEFEYIATSRPEGEEEEQSTGTQQDGGPLRDITGPLPDPSERAGEEVNATTGTTTDTTTARGTTTGMTPQQGAPISSAPTTFQSNVDSIRVGVPNGWVFEDINNTDPGLQQSEQSYGAEILAELCPQKQAKHQIGGTYLCPDAEESFDSVSILRFADLKSRPEFASVVQRNQSITTNDLVAFYLQFLEQKANFTNIKLLKNVDTTVDVIDPQTGVSIVTAPAKHIQISYVNANGTSNDGNVAFLVLSTDVNTGYALLPVASLVTTAGELSPQHQLVFDTFELMAWTGTSNLTTTAGPPISSSPSQRMQQQEQGLQIERAPSSELPQSQQHRLPANQEVSIIAGSYRLTTDAYSPNPAQVSVGGTVIWTNDDSQPHTATSGQNATPDHRFDSGILAPVGTFSHTFTEAGEYPYYCLLHPNMVGTVIVN